MPLTAGLVDIEIDPIDLVRVRKDAYRLETSQGTIMLRGQRIVRAEVDRGKKIFTNAIARYVYSAPQISQGYERTYRLRGGVRSKDFSLGMAAGEIYIDPGIVGKNGYFYPLSVEFGLTSKPSYYARYYWLRGKQEARIGFRQRVESMSKGLLYEIIA